VAVAPPGHGLHSGSVETHWKKVVSLSGVKRGSKTTSFIFYLLLITKIKKVMINNYTKVSITFAAVTLFFTIWLLITLFPVSSDKLTNKEKEANDEKQRADEKEKQRAEEAEKQREEEEEKQREEEEEKQREEEREKLSFEVVPGAGSNNTGVATGFCKGPSDSFPSYKNITEDCDTMAARHKCASDNNCVAFNVNEKSKQCQLFYLNITAPNESNMSNASANWKDNNFFPLYASPYVCPVIKSPKNAGGCTSTYPEACAVVPDWTCYQKNMSSPRTVIPPFSESASADALHCSVIVSNPYLPTSKLLTTTGTFFWWLYNMLQECPANSELFLCNVYITLFVHSNEDPEDYVTQCYYALKNALLRNVVVWWIVVASDSQQCQADILAQDGLKEHVGVNLKVVDFGTSGFYFFHDKIYLSEKRAYVGGQNLSRSASIDCGVELLASSPLFADVRRRVEYLRNKGMTALTFSKTMDAPFVTPDSSASYFIAVSPSAPTQTGQQGVTNCNFPQQPQLKQKNNVGPFVVNSPWQYEGHVSYELPHLLNIINKSRVQVSITNYDWSVYGDFFTTIKMGSNWSIALALEAALKRGVKVNIWINAMPFSDQLTCGNTTCVALRCFKFSSWLRTIESSYPSVFNLHWWYQNPAGDKFNNYCHPLHAKICYTDAGIHVSSSNLTPQYYNGTQDTGFCGVFNTNAGAPHWLDNGIMSVFNLLTTHSKSGSFTCDNNSTPNFQTTSSTQKPLCVNDAYCTNTCVGRVGMFSNCDVEVVQPE
jgi:phosphatidylserine/phosphatidylglycerophosphate/cardiolipin synthase-like enzyme